MSKHVSRGKVWIPSPRLASEPRIPQDIVGVRIGCGSKPRVVGAIVAENGFKQLICQLLDFCGGTDDAGAVLWREKECSHVAAGVSARLHQAEPGQGKHDLLAC